MHDGASFGKNNDVTDAADGFPEFHHPHRQLTHVRCEKQDNFSEDRKFYFKAGDFVSTYVAYTSANFNYEFTKVFKN